MRPFVRSSAAIALSGFSLLAQTVGPPLSSKPQSQWVYFTGPGTLGYKALPSGDRIMDFSSAGYGGGGVALPDVPVVSTVQPTGADDTAAIQSAINQLSQHPLVNGLRGAVLLSAGTFSVSGGLTISASGVVLRGSGSGDSGTRVNMTGDPHTFLTLAGSGSPQPSGTAVPIVDAYVPAGANSFQVTDASSFAIGQSVLITRPVTAAWVHFMGMDALVRDGAPETWLAPGSTTKTLRTVAAISGNVITLDAPLSDNIDAHYLQPPGATLVHYTFPGRISNVGVEHLQLVAPPSPVPFGSPINQLLTFTAVINGWARDIVALDTVSSVTASGTTKQITIADIHLTHSVINPGSALYADFTLTGTQILLDAVSSVGNHLFYIATESGPDGAQGPNVVMDSTFTGDGSIQPHQRWSTGLLVDCSTVKGGAIELIDRGYDGTGHGWTMGSGVVWNSRAPSLTIQAPPGSENFCIGCQGAVVAMKEPGSGILPSNGIYDSLNAFVLPRSLYRAQLAQRLHGQIPPLY